MATKKKDDAKTYSKSSRCWPGYEPVPGKSEHEEGSCRKKPASRNGGQEVNRETARKKQISQGGKRAEQAKSKSPSATERKHARTAAKTKTGAKKKTGKAGKTTKAASKKRAPAKKTASKKGTARKKASSSKAGSHRAAAAK